MYTYPYNFDHIKYGIYTNIFAEKMFFQQKIPVNKILFLLEQLTFWPQTSSLS